MTDEVQSKTFWTILGATFVIGVSLSSIVWSEIQSHRDRSFHAGMPIYVEQRIAENNKDLIEELRLLRGDIQDLRESVIAAGIALK